MSEGNTLNGLLQRVGEDQKTLIQEVYKIPLDAVVKAKAKGLPLELPIYEQANFMISVVTLARLIHIGDLELLAIIPYFGNWEDSDKARLAVALSRGGFTVSLRFLTEAWGWPARWTEGAVVYHRLRSYIRFSGSRKRSHRDSSDSD